MRAMAMLRVAAVQASYVLMDRAATIDRVAAVREAIGDPGATILDVRTRDEYLGERFWPSGGMEPGGRAGHVPSAVHQPIDGLHDDRGSFRPPAKLRAVFSAITPGDSELITYGTIGGGPAPGGSS